MATTSLDERAKYKCTVSTNGVVKYFYEGKPTKKVDVPKDVLASMICEQKGVAKVAERAAAFEKAPERAKAKEEKEAKPVKRRAKKKSPQRSPKKSPERSPKRSPKKSPQKSPKKSPKKRGPKKQVSFKSRTPPPVPPRSVTQSILVRGKNLTISSGVNEVTFEVSNGVYDVKKEGDMVTIQKKD